MHYAPNIKLPAHWHTTLASAYSPLTSDFLRVEFKTQPKEERSLRGRYHREATTPDDNLERVQFENAQIRITRVVCAPRGRSSSERAAPSRRS